MKRFLLVLSILAVGSFQIALPVKVGRSITEAQCSADDRVRNSEAYLTLGFGLAHAGCGGGESEGPRGPGSPQSPTPDPRPGGSAF